MPETLVIKGKVFSGSGEGAKYVKLPWVKKQIAAKCGFTPYPGTLNVKLVEKNFVLKDLAKKVKAVEISSKEGFCRGVCFRAIFKDSTECVIVLPEITGYPDNIVEIVAPVNLREKFGLKDGETVEVKIVLE